MTVKKTDMATSSVRKLMKKMVAPGGSGFGSTVEAQAKERELDLNAFVAE